MSENAALKTRAVDEACAGGQRAPERTDLDGPPETLGLLEMLWGPVATWSDEDSGGAPSAPAAQGTSASGAGAMRPAFPSADTGEIVSVAPRAADAPAPRRDGGSCAAPVAAPPRDVCEHGRPAVAIPSGEALG